MTVRKIPFVFDYSCDHCENFAVYDIDDLYLCEECYKIYLEDYADD